MEAPQGPDEAGPAFWAAAEDCICCGGLDYGSGYGPRTLVFCQTCQARGTHVECWHTDRGQLITEAQLESPAFQWFCSEASWRRAAVGCQKISERLVELTGVQQPLAKLDASAAGSGEFSVELVRWSPHDRACQKGVSAALDIFKKAFAPLPMSNGRNLIEMVCQAYETPEEEVAAAEAAAEAAAAARAGQEGGEGEEEEDGGPEAFDFSNFRVLLLRKKGAVVSAAALRAFGTRFAEVPFVATREGYRREGHCRRLMGALEGLLHGMGIRWVILPAMKGALGRGRDVLPMWTGHFGYTLVGEGEVSVLESRIVMPHPDSASLVRKVVEAPAAAAAARKGKAPAVALLSGRGVRFQQLGRGYKESSSDEEEDAEEEERSGGGRRGGGSGKRGKAALASAKASWARGRGRKQQDEGSDYEVSEEEEEEEGDEELEGLVAEGDEDKEGGPQGSDGEPAAAAVAAAARGGQRGRAAAAGEAAGSGPACASCGALKASKSRETGQYECRACKKTRRETEGGGAGAADGKRTAPPRAPAAAAVQNSDGATRTAVAAAAAAAPTAPPAGTPQATREQRRAARRAAVWGLPPPLPALFYHAQGQAEHEWMCAQSAAAHRVETEQLVADQLAGHLLRLVQDADEQPALEAQALEQRIRALEQRLEAEAAARADADARAAAEAQARAAAQARERDALQLLQQQQDFMSQLLQQAAAAAAAEQPEPAAAAAAAAPSGGWDSGPAAQPGDTMAATADGEDALALGGPSTEEGGEPLVALPPGPTAMHTSPAAPALPAGPGLPSPTAGAAAGSGRESGRRRLTTGRSSGSAGGRRRVRAVRSRPAPLAGAGRDAPPAGDAVDATPASSQQQQVQQQQQQQQQQGQADGTPAGESEDWGQGLFGIFGGVGGGSSGSAADGAAVADNSQLPPPAAAPSPSPLSGLPAASPGLSLDGVAPTAAAGGPHRPTLAAAMHRALGSQESRSLAAGGAAQLAGMGSLAACHCGPTPAPSPAAGALEAAPDQALASAAASQLAELRLQQVQSAGGPAGSGLSSRAAGAADAEAAVAAVAGVAGSFAE